MSSTSAKSEPFSSGSGSCATSAKRSGTSIRCPSASVCHSQSLAFSWKSFSSSEMISVCRSSSRSHACHPSTDFIAASATNARNAAVRSPKRVSMI